MERVKDKLTPGNIFRWILELSAMTGLYFLLHTGGIKKYILLLVISVALMFFGRKKPRTAEAVICVALPAVVYLLSGTLSTLLNANPQMTSVKDALFWMVPVIFSVALYVFWGTDMTRIVDFQFIGSCIAYLYSYRHWLLWYGKAEDAFAFVFGAFAIYYVYKKRWIFLPIAVVLMYFADKKIAFLAMSVCIVLLGILWIGKKSMTLALTIWNLGIVGIFYYVYAIQSGILKHICYSMGIIGNGRMTMYDRFQDLYSVSPFFWGKGLGNIANILDCWAIPTYDHLHNDLLKFYMELGFWGFLFFLLSFGITFYLAGRRFGKNSMCGLLAMVVHSMILFMTDNVSIYVIYMVPFYTICFAMLVSDEKQGRACAEEKAVLK